jgi:capsular polysaccharide biosynthesis protein
MYETETEAREHERLENDPDTFRMPRADTGGRVSVFMAAIHYPFLVVLPILLLVGAGAFLGLHRKPNYTANVRLQVASIDPNQPGAATGFATATAALASSYSRLVGADTVIDPVAKRYHVSPQTVAHRVSATPIPDSPLFMVSATDKSSRSSMTLANAVADSLTAYISDINQQDPSPTSLYRRYRAASKSATRARMLQDKLRARFDASKTDANAAALQDATAAAETYTLRARSLGDEYDQAQHVQLISAPPRIVTRPRTAKSDRKSRLELAIFFGFVAGAIIGLALATLRESRRVRGRLVTRPA